MPRRSSSAAIASNSAAVSRHDGGAPGGDQPRATSSAWPRTPPTGITWPHYPGTRTQTCYQHRSPAMTFSAAAISGLVWKDYGHERPYGSLAGTPGARSSSSSCTASAADVGDLCLPVYSHGSRASVRRRPCPNWNSANVNTVLPEVVRPGGFADCRVRVTGVLRNPPRAGRAAICFRWIRTRVLN